MLVWIKNWVVSICFTVFFITAVEMILPNNKLKKYAKFVLGLILITVLINPIIKLFNKDFDINTYANNASESIEQNKYTEDFQKYKDKGLKETISTFELNLETSCVEKLKEKYPGSEYQVKVDADYDSDKQKFTIKNIKVGVKEEKIVSIKRIGKIKLGEDSTSVNNNQLNNETGDKIKDYLSTQLDVSKNIIDAYKL